MSTHYPLKVRYDEIPDDNSLGLQHRGMALIAIKKNQTLYLYLNQCPHLGIPLEWQEDQFLSQDKSLIQCYTHGALFSIDSGYCISGPCQGEHLRTVNYRIEGQQVMIEEASLHHH